MIERTAVKAAPVSAKPGILSVLAALARDRSLWLYSAATLLGAPLFLVRKWRTKRHHKLDCEFDPSRWRVRFPARAGARAKYPHDTSGPRVAIFTPGWGELETMKPLVQALRAARPDARLLFVTKHYETIAPASELSDEEVSPVPFDNVLSVARWLTRMRPDVAVFYERFDYGVLLRALWLRRVPFLIVHTRKRWKLARSPLDARLKKWPFHGLYALCLPSATNLAGAEQCTPDQTRVEVVGSIKFPAAPPAMNALKEAQLRDWIESGAQGAPLLAAGSTHETEETFVLDALEMVRQHTTGPAPVLLLAPRKPARSEAIAALLESRNLRVSRRSQFESQPTPAAVDVLLLDTLGELKTAYRWAQAAFVGGTLVGEAHNVAEPLIWSIPVSFGPYQDNFAVECALCLEAGVGASVHTPAELAAHWAQVLESPDLRRELATKADALIAAQSQAFARTLQILIDAVDEAGAEF